MANKGGLPCLLLCLPLTNGQALLDGLSAIGVFMCACVCVRVRVHVCVCVCEQYVCVFTLLTMLTSGASTLAADGMLDADAEGGWGDDADLMLDEGQPLYCTLVC